MIKCKEVSRKEYEKAVYLPTVQLLLSTWCQELHTASVRHQKYKSNVDKTVEFFLIHEQDDVVYVDINSSELSVKVGKPFWKSQSKEKSPYKILKFQLKTVLVGKDSIHDRISNDQLLPTQK